MVWLCAIVVIIDWCYKGKGFNSCKSERVVIDYEDFVFKDLIRDSFCKLFLFLQIKRRVFEYPIYESVYIV